MSGDIPQWIPKEVIEYPDSHIAQGFWRGLASGSSIVPGRTPDEVAANLRLLEELEKGFVQQS